MTLNMSWAKCFETLGMSGQSHIEEQWAHYLRNLHSQLRMESQANTRITTKRPGKNYETKTYQRGYVNESWGT